MEQNGTVQMTELQKKLVQEFMAELAVSGMTFLIKNVSDGVSPHDATESIIAATACMLVDTLIHEPIPKESRAKRFENIVVAMRMRFENGNV